MEIRQVIKLVEAVHGEMVYQGVRYYVSKMYHNKVVAQCVNKDIVEESTLEGAEEIADVAFINCEN